MLDAGNLGIGYGGRRVGRNITLSVEREEVFCLLGPNGCGKTTLFKTLLGLIPAIEGTLLIGGQDAASLSRRAFARLIGYVPQASVAYFPFTMFEVVLMGRAARVPAFAQPSGRDRDAARAALATLGIAHLAERPFTAVSGGERQMALIARALAQEPEMIVMDEPTANLDFANQARVLGQARRLARSGVAVVMSTHDPSHAFAIADRVALMKEGELVAVGSPVDVLTPTMLKTVYGVAVAVAFVESLDRHLCAPQLETSDHGGRP